MEHKTNATLQQALRTANSFSPCNVFTDAVLEKLKICRTEKLGWHLYQCNNEKCAEKKMQFHSCRNRHCPNCGASGTDEWIEDRMRELFPVNYFHIVFTMPHELNSLCMQYRKEIFDLLFNSSSYTLLKFSEDEEFLGANVGIIQVLHTWGQQLSFHPHIHCIVSGGGIDKHGKWKNAKSKYGNFLFPVNAMKKVYKGFFLSALKKFLKEKQILDTEELLNTIENKEWIVHAKKPFGGPMQVVEYLGRYTHKVAISNHRIIFVDENSVIFSYKDYADAGKKKTMKLSLHEFLRRFEQHILPKRFVKIRSCGYLTNRDRTTRINAVRKQFDLQALPQKTTLPFHLRLMEKYAVDIFKCPCCESGRLQLIKIEIPAAERKEVKFVPADWKAEAENFLSR